MGGLLGLGVNKLKEDRLHDQAVSNWRVDGKAKNNCERSDEKAGAVQFRPAGHNLENHPIPGICCVQHEDQIFI